MQLNEISLISVVALRVVITLAVLVFAYKLARGFKLTGSAAERAFLNKLLDAVREAVDDPNDPLVKLVDKSTDATLRNLTPSQISTILLSFVDYLVDKVNNVPRRE